MDPSLEFQRQSCFATNQKTNQKAMIKVWKAIPILCALSFSLLLFMDNPHRRRWRQREAGTYRSMDMDHVRGFDDHRPVAQEVHHTFWCARLGLADTADVTPLRNPNSIPRVDYQGKHGIHYTGETEGIYSEEIKHAI